MSTPTITQPALYPQAEHDTDATFERFVSQVEETPAPQDYPLAASIDSRIPIYQCSELRHHLVSSDFRSRLMIEWSRLLQSGPGVLVLKGAYPEIDLIDKVTAVFNRILEKEQAAGLGAGDHFAKGSNSRVWNTHEKLALEAPALFIQYNRNPWIAMTARAWLGPGYQITAQLNVVHPGGEAQRPHRDYHMGFMPVAAMEQFPQHAHELSAQLTLQGAIAHSAMPVESGPTQLLPNSQKLQSGYLLAGQPRYQAYFQQHQVQLPLDKGDVLFFNPALLHAAGTNRTKNQHRMANLLQIGSAFGRSIETINRTRLCVSIYPELQRLYQQKALSDLDVDAVISASAEGYAFPTNLDNDLPVDGLAPRAPQEMLRRALEESWTSDQLSDELSAADTRRLA